MSLQEYRRKRNFRKTAEPAPKVDRQNRHRFVIQKHDATRLHYDFRLELGGTLKSWAVPKGLPYAKGDKRLAVHVEDHPVSYIAFEGTIPKGQYGGGTVMVWDEGTFETDDPHPLKTLEQGKLHVTLHGKKLKGAWYLVRLRDSDEWLIIRGGDDHKPVSKKQDDTSVRSGKSMAQLAKSGDVWQSKPVNGSSLKTRLQKAAASADANSEVGRVVPNAPVGRRATRKSASPSNSADSDSSPAPARPRKTGAAPKFLEPMKALLVDEPEASGEWLYEIKFDGFRALAFKRGDSVHLLSRNEKDFVEKFPEIADAIAELAVDDVILDGEIVALDKDGRSSFQLLQGLDTADRPPLYFYVFDLLRLDGKSLLDQPLTARKAALEKLLRKAPDAIRFSASLEGELPALMKRAQQLGLEGLIGKRPDSTYEVGKRTGSWIKLKISHEQEFVIGGYTPPGGSRKHIGALIVGVYEGEKLICTGKVGSGFNHELLKSLHARFAKLARKDCPFDNLPDKRERRYGQAITASVMKTCHWLKPELVCQIRFTEWTNDGRLRHPVFLGLREDKAATDVVREKPARS
jgi:bifunctional non-homologous end joining protein LigD